MLKVILNFTVGWKSRVINRVRGLGSGPHTPTQFFSESIPPPGGSDLLGA